jgi:DNA-binding CsgD family transcriptional regulator/PAS domain-containing protein
LPERNILELVERCYAAIALPDGWADFLDAASRAFDAPAATLGTCSRQLERFEWGVASGLTEAEHADRWQWGALNPRIDTVRRLGRPREVFSFDDGQDIAGYKRSSYYANVGSRLDLLWAVIAWLDEGRDIVGGLALHRSERAPCFDSIDIHQVTVLSRHICRALQLQRDLAAARAETSLHRDLLDRLPIGLVLLTADGRVVDMNGSARAMLDGEDGLRLRAQRIELQDRAAQRAFAQQRHAAAGAAVEGIGGVVQVPRPSGKPAYVLSVARCFVDLSRLLGAGAAVLVSIADPTRTLALSASALHELWDLTAAEAQIAIAIAAGSRLEEIAARNHTSRETVRVHLRRILAKTGAHRQSELVRLILAGPGSVLPPH